ncbi:hypothetical protein Pan216_52670 [Planctomycetes bacterium Pan216]|uniref:DUF4159 domain-containing protein n=1 Tax=Kolteria novifilia TaxID=2527975 RepID=A0A518BBQ5_9BACT|nr:hypothetical protein Pan216_52670 [Planctomycetes bacterium Pan216]
MILRRAGLTLLLSLSLLSLPCVGTLQAQAPEDVNRAIERAVDFLKSKQRHGIGNWEEMGDYKGGVTSLVVLSMLLADVSPDDDRIKKALVYLRQVPPEYTYVVALQTMVFAEAKSDFGLIRRNAKWLMETRLPSGNWSYGRRGGAGDNSNTQFALLGLKAAADAGVNINEEFWKKSRQHWVNSQSNVGSWGYRGIGDATGSMSVAGISSLIITSRQFASVKKGFVDGRAVRCDGALIDENLRRAIDWIGRNFSVSRNPAGGNEVWLFYYLYGLERAGRLTGQRFFGNHDWYRLGVRFLLTQQRLDGSWSTPRAAQGPYLLCNTAFSLLFLTRGRIPILVNKAQWGAGDDWNNAPNDVNNLTEFMSKTVWKKRLNWQSVDLKVADVAALLQAPILQMSGHEAPRLPVAQRTLLRRFVEQGGLLMADSNCSCGSFDQGFRTLCKDLFPGPGQELKRLEPDHPVWTSLFDLRNLADDWPLFGIDVGCRTGVFYSPKDMSCRWEFPTEEASLPAFRLGANIIAYAVGPEDLLDKLDVRKVFDDVPEDEIKRGYLHIAKVRHNGDWNPAPRAIQNLMSSLQEIAKIDVIRQQRDIEILDPNFFNYPLVYMHGRNAFTLSKKEKETLTDYLESGGVLFADACCGSERFADSFREMVEELFPGQKLKPIPVEHELFTQEIGYDLSKVKLSKALGSREVAPVLEGLEIDGRYAIIFSPYDIGCALERHQGSDCKGYTHEAALKLASNVILYALKQ